MSKSTTFLCSRHIGFTLLFLPSPLSCHSFVQRELVEGALDTMCPRSQFYLGETVNTIAKQSIVSSRSPAYAKHQKPDYCTVRACVCASARLPCVCLVCLSVGDPSTPCSFALLRFACPCFQFGTVSGGLGCIIPLSASEWSMLSAVRNANLHPLSSLHSLAKLHPLANLPLLSHKAPVIMFGPYYCTRALLLCENHITMLNSISLRYGDVNVRKP